MKNGLKINNNFYKNHNLHYDGFTLIEVVVSITLFAIFVLAFLTTEGSNVRDSVVMKEELLLQRLCEYKLQEILLDPPELRESLTLTPKKGNLEEIGYADYEYVVEYKRLKIPNLSAITGEGAEEEGAAADAGSADGGAGASADGGVNGAGGGMDKESKDKQSKIFQNKIFEMIKKNVEEMVWQVKVTVQNKNSNFPFSLVTFINNKKAKIKMDL
ncbi:MAG: prepilin-type N-terminal cleavage/methylation domain-containing protein [Oligoflexia bacterium]|nr:prepilin-type N-terminal cleavage/methylation domain-containing protein [Oligoflexia bacterium]